MAREEHEDDLLRTRAGRLDETAEHSNIRRLLHMPRRRSGYMPSFRSQQRKTCTFQEIEHRYPASYRIEATRAAVVTPFHMQQTYLSRRPLPSLPAAVLIGRRTQIWPSRRQAKILKSVPGARYHRGSRVWTLPSDHRFLQTPLGKALSSPLARTAATLRRTRIGRDGIKRQAIWFAHYLTRTGPLADRADELVHDRAGPIVEGTIGKSADELSNFWSAADAAESRVDARVQERLIIEVPCWLPTEEMRNILQRFGAELTARGLPWVGAVHRPDPHGDPRNVHIHIVVGTRPIVGWETRPLDKDPDTLRRDPIFADKKDRAMQGEKWISHLRKIYAEIVNQISIEWSQREGRMIARIFHAGSNAEIGIETVPSRHRGPRQSAIDRRIVARGDEPRRVPIYEVQDERRMAQILRGFNADQAAFLALCERIERLAVDADATESIRSSHASLLTAADAAAAAIELCEEKIEAVLAEFQVDGDHENQITDHDQMSSDSIRELVDAVRVTVSRSHDIEKELIAVLAHSETTRDISPLTESAAAETKSAKELEQAEATIDHLPAINKSVIHPIEEQHLYANPSSGERPETERSEPSHNVPVMPPPEQPQSIVAGRKALIQRIQGYQRAIAIIIERGWRHGATATRHAEAREAQFEAFKRRLAAEEAVERCERLITSIIESSPENVRREAASHDASNHDSPVYLEQLLNELDVADRLISETQQALEGWEEIERKLQDVPYIDEYLLDSKNLVPRTLEESDPDWVVAEIQRQLKKCRWVPRHHGQRIVKPMLRDADITLGDVVEARVRYSQENGWTIEFPRFSSESARREATDQQRLWIALITQLFEASTQSVGSKETAGILKCYGFTKIEPDKNGIIEIRRSDGLLRVAHDGRFASVYGSNVDLHAAFDAFAHARHDSSGDIALQKILESKKEPPLVFYPNDADRKVDLIKIANDILHLHEILPIDRQRVQLVGHALKKHEKALETFHPTLTPNEKQVAVDDSSSRPPIIESKNQTEADLEHAREPRRHLARQEDDSGIFGRLTRGIVQWWRDTTEVQGGEFRSIMKPSKRSPMSFDARAFEHHGSRDASSTKAPSGSPQNKQADTKAAMHDAQPTAAARAATPPQSPNIGNAASGSVHDVIQSMRSRGRDRDRGR